MAPQTTNGNHTEQTDTDAPTFSFTPREKTHLHCNTRRRRSTSGMTGRVSKVSRYTAAAAYLLEVSSPLVRRVAEAGERLVLDGLVTLTPMDSSPDHVRHPAKAAGGTQDTLQAESEHPPRPREGKGNKKCGRHVWFQGCLELEGRLDI